MKFCFKKKKIVSVSVHFRLIASFRAMSLEPLFCEGRIKK